MTNKPRFKRLVKSLENPMTEIYLLFYQFVLVQFVAFSLFFAEIGTMCTFRRGTNAWFLEKITDKVCTCYCHQECRITTWCWLDTSRHVCWCPGLADWFHNSSKTASTWEQWWYFSIPTQPIIGGCYTVCRWHSQICHQTFLFNNQLLSNAKFINLETRLEASFECVQYFVENFPNVLNFTPQEIGTQRRNAYSAWLGKTRQISVFHWNQIWLS